MVIVSWRVSRVDLEGGDLDVSSAEGEGEMVVLMDSMMQ